MSDMHRIIILGGHGKVALLATRRLHDAGFAVDSLIRDPDQGDDIRAAGGNPIVLDIESASVQDMTGLFGDAAAVVFSAGAGGGSDPDRTRAVDYNAAIRAMAATEQAGVQRFIMVSYADAATDVDRLAPDHSFYPYAKAKHDADAHLRQTRLDYTILGPARLTTEPATGQVQLASEAGDDWPQDKRVTSRGNVAAMIAHVIQAHAAIRQTVNFYDGTTPLADVMHPA